MKVENGTITLESRTEVELLQNVCEGFLALSKSAVEDEEKKLAKELSAKLEAMWYGW